MVEVLVRGIEQLQFRWEAFAAIFSSDTLAAATQRHQARLAEMNQIFAQMYADAAKGSEAAKGAITTVANTAAEIAKRLEAVRQGTQEAVGRGVEAVHAAVEKLKSRLGDVEQAVAKANGVVSDATAKMAEAFKSLTAIVEVNLQRQVEAVKARYQQEQAALELSHQSQAQQIAKSVLLLADALSQQTTLRRQATTQTLQLIDEESKARIDAARRQGLTEAERSANVTRVENEILATKRQSMAQAATEYRAHIDALNAQANRHLVEIQRIEEAKRQLSLTTEEKIRELRRLGMTDFQATEDRKRQILELQSKAREVLAQGEFEQARLLAQKAMDLAAQVATSQTTDARRAEDAKKQSEQAFTQVVLLEAQSREAYRKQEYAAADALARQADALRAELSQKAKESDAAITQGKQGINSAIEAIRTSEEILNAALDAQAQAHQRAAQAALAARDQIKQTLTDTETQIDQITAKLKDGLKLTLDADTTRVDKALADLDKALLEKERLLPIKADLEQAQKKLQEYEQLLKEGKTLPIDADVSAAKAALDKLTVYAKENSLLELRVSTEKAQASITNVEGMIKALDGIRTESQHELSTNADAARAQVLSLNGMNTSSTHTIYVSRVEVNATGGLVGAGISRFADGGAVPTQAAAAFSRMRGGPVPGAGDQDTVARTLDAGAFVLRKAAVRKYGSTALAKLVSAMAGPGMHSNGKQAAPARITPEDPSQRSQRSARETQDPNTTGQTARTAMDRPLAQGDDQQREQLALVRQRQGQFFGGVGVSKSDTVPAMLTPGEYVVNRFAVSRFGAGFFDSLNNLSMPAQALARGVQGFASGGIVTGAISRGGIDRPVLEAATSPMRTLRVELAAHGSKVNAQIDERDEGRLLRLLQSAQMRAA